MANEGASNVLAFAHGAISPFKTLGGPNQNPVDVTVCPNGTVYVSNLAGISPSGPGSISVYASGSTIPTGNLFFPGEQFNYFVACDAAGNVFSTIRNSAGVGRVVGYPGGQQSGARDLGITLSAPGGIKPNSAGNLLIGDQDAHTITEYTESGTPTGNEIGTGPSDIIDIAVTRNSQVVGGADAANGVGSSWAFPGVYGSLLP